MGGAKHSRTTGAFGQDFANEVNQVCRKTVKDLENLSTGSREELVAAIDTVIEQAREASQDFVDIDERPEGAAGQTASRCVG